MLVLHLSTMAGNNMPRTEASFYGSHSRAKAELAKQPARPARSSVTELLRTIEGNHLVLQDRRLPLHSLLPVQNDPVPPRKLKGKVLFRALIDHLDEMMQVPRLHAVEADKRGVI
eukprot:gnl/TRDRNA2_/TRDRNA2_72076_c0_seq1.p2 gnl/TRDRNA2_/TRDRNA2_72076_c0~~gnl/TRDRNA2_/TRDRNA2_72076_c0_seq1.p2  ORF type:complete len:115 (+),score=14.19 gnl/TRDRNA2_/TRDRNA2_72076_c0_seq1:277-621(+)